MNLFNHALRVWAQQREFRAVFAELARHSDRELRDMGIDRSDITRTWYQAGSHASRSRRRSRAAGHSIPFELPEITRRERARFVKVARRRRAIETDKLLRCVGRGVARLVRSLTKPGTATA
jgi:uncharacterized protein YjiS (DUF1127 family)